MVYKIYKLFNKINSDILPYYGSTNLPLNIRLRTHKSSYYQYKLNKFHYITSFSLYENSNIDDIDIELIQEIDLDDKKLICDIERSYIENNICCNKYIPNRTRKEYSKYYYNKYKKNYHNNKYDQNIAEL